ncbi:cyclic di-GMP binding protein [Spirochaetia bacterium]|nr:cyclic di-GMP binding protein [Spirochaetia bacterium]
MGIVTGQKITTYYERFKSVNVTYTKELIQVTGLMTQQVYFKCGTDFWPCVVYSSSFEEAKIVVNTQSGLPAKLQQANNAGSLRFCFKNSETDAAVTFFVAGRVLGSSPYGASKDISLMSLQFTQRPPDDLIEILGRILDANVNSSKRRSERILLNVDSIRKLKLLTKETAVFIQGVPRRCMLRDIAFAGAKLIMMGVPKFLMNRQVSLRMDFDDPRESFLLNGTFTRAEDVEGRKELIALVAEFDEAVLPMGYKLRLSDYFSQVRMEKPDRPLPAASTPVQKTPEPEPVREAPAEETPAQVQEQPGEGTE